MSRRPSSGNIAGFVLLFLLVQIAIVAVIAVATGVVTVELPR